MSKRVLVTGAFGQLGQAVLMELQAHFDLLATGKSPRMRESHLCREETLDLRDGDACARVLRQFCPQVVVHLAAETSVDRCERDREHAWDTNVRGTENLLKALKGTPARVILLSTDYVFDGSDGPYDEEAKPDPVNYYGRTKLAAENAVRGSGLPWTILRTNVLYGAASGQKQNFVSWVVAALSRGVSIRVVTDQFNNPTWTGAMAEVIGQSVLLPLEGLFHYGGSTYLSRLEFAQQIARCYDLDAGLILPVCSNELSQPAPRPPKGGVKSDRIETATGVPAYPVDYCLRKVHEGVVA